jgi:tetratricopeptide (TPR) repeat protein
MASGAELAEEWSAELGAALARHSADPSVQREVELAGAYRAAGILDQAYDHYQVAARRDPREAAAWDGLARIWRDWGYPQIGLGDAHRAVWANPSSPIARNTLGTILRMLGKYQDARDQFARAVAIDAGAAYAHYNLAVVCETQRQYVAAAEAFERAAALDPSLEVAGIRARTARQQAADAAGKGASHERR